MAVFIFEIDFHLVSEDENVSKSATLDSKMAAPTVIKGIVPFLMVPSQVYD